MLSATLSLAACGGHVVADRSPPPDDEPFPSDAFAPPPAPSKKPIPPPIRPAPKDAGPKAPSDAGPGYVLVDGGTACLPPLPKIYEPVRTCCNGKLCEGYCILFDDAGAPECTCGGVPGGCPSPHVCCPSSCTILSACMSGK